MQVLAKRAFLAIAIGTVFGATGTNSLADSSKPTGGYEITEQDWQGILNGHMSSTSDSKPSKQQNGQSLEGQNHDADKPEISLSDPAIQAKLQVLNQELDRNPKDVHALGRRGDLYREAHAYEKAESDYSAGIALQPEKQIGYIVRSECEIPLKKYSAALKDLDKAFEIGPPAVDILESRYGMQMQLEHYKSAVQDASSLIATEPQVADHYLRKAMAYLGLGDQASALRFCKKALALNPHLSFAHKLKEKLDSSHVQ